MGPGASPPALSVHRDIHRFSPRPGGNTTVMCREWLGRLSVQINPTDHGAACQTSCHDCMRDYSNLAYPRLAAWARHGEASAGRGGPDGPFTALLDRRPRFGHPAPALRPGRQQRGEPRGPSRRCARPQGSVRTRATGVETSNFRNARNRVIVCHMSHHLDAAMLLRLCLLARVLTDPS